MAIEGLHPVLGTPVINKEQEAGGKLRKEKRRRKRRGKKKETGQDETKEGRVDIRV